MRVLKRFVKSAFQKSGLDIQRTADPGFFPYEDFQGFVPPSSPDVVVFDVGANIGQSVGRFKHVYPQAVLHAFEPGPAAYRELSEACKEFSNVHPWNYGVGSSEGNLRFKENSDNQMSSFLAPAEAAWGEFQQEIDVQVVTLDEFAARKQIPHIHILKTDTQGFELDVFKGASGLLAERKIDVIYFEVIFSDMYENMPPFYRLYEYLCEQGYLPGAFYRSKYQNGIVGWSDAMFVSPSLVQSRKSS